jgi:hypothetical protein
VRLSEQKDSDLLNPNAPPGGGKRRRQGAVIGLVAAIIVGASVGLTSGYFQRLFSGPALPDQVTNTQRWSQWGMSIAYPAGLSPNVTGVSSSQADSRSGTVQWTWNNGHNVLAVLWFNASGYNYTAGFQGIQSKLAQAADSFALTDHGNSTIGSATWQYETFRIVKGGQTAYGTYALNFVAQSGRLYELAFGSDNSNTLSSLTYYGKTFSG